ncbi:MAG: hypothetical protein OEU09_19245 [Rhodospirillales bacterium]|nr:hypothetical protein [Rhodospirillales bacterium]MDH3913421.1 hypothetical protein [Rhodospirillales bacterium]MDH3969477.1 hypothetical protein [Rhodospirillales bacterium]
MRDKAHRIIVIALLGALAGCATGTGDVVRDQPGPDYVQNAAALVAAADWSKTRDVTVVVSEYKFAPADPIFQVRRAYRLILRNAGKNTHTFVSEGFFKAIAVQKLVSATGTIANPTLESIELPPGAEKQLYFVPVKRGTFALECSVFLHDTYGMEGRITIL